EPGRRRAPDHGEEQHHRPAGHLDDRGPRSGDEPEPDVDRTDPGDQRGLEPETPGRGEEQLAHGDARGTQEHADEDLAPAREERAHVAPSARARWKVSTAPTYAKVVIETKASTG